MTRYWGLFLLCPVFVYDPEGDAPTLSEMHWSLLPLFWLSVVLYDSYSFVRTLFDKNFEPMYPVLYWGQGDDDDY